MRPVHIHMGFVRTPGQNAGHDWRPNSWESKPQTDRSFLFSSQKELAQVTPWVSEKVAACIRAAELKISHTNSSLDALIPGWMQESLDPWSLLHAPPPLHPLPEITDPGGRGDIRGNYFQFLSIKLVRRCVSEN